MNPAPATVAPTLYGREAGPIYVLMVPIIKVIGKNQRFSITPLVREFNTSVEFLRSIAKKRIVMPPTRVVSPVFRCFYK